MTGAAALTIGQHDRSWDGLGISYTKRSWLRFCYYAPQARRVDFVSSRGKQTHQGERMQIQKFLPGLAMSALLAMTAPGNAAENAVQKEGNAMEAKGNAQEKKAVREKKAAENEKAAGEAKKAKGEQMQKDAEKLEKHDGTATEGTRMDHAGATEKAKGEKMEQSAKAHKEHAKKTQKAADEMEKSGNKVEKAGTAIDKK